MQTQTNLYIFWSRESSLLYFFDKNFLLMIKAVMYLNITAFS